jgi:DNA-binding response OmpR family regulator
MYTDHEGQACRVGTALVLEDEVLVSTLIEDYLIELGVAEVITAVDTEHAHRVATEQPLHFAVLDVLVGKDNSFAVADRLAERGVPFVFASGCWPDDLPERHRNRPFLVKPFSNHQLAEVVRELVGGLTEAR